MARDNEAASRAAAIRAERRGRDDSALNGTKMRLQVREDTLDRESWSYRYVNDVGSRVHYFKSRGYEVVSDRNQAIKDDGVGMGAEVAQLVDTSDHGAAIKAVLMRIPKTIFDEDQRAKQAKIDEKEAASIKPAAELRDRETTVSRSGQPSG